MAGRAAGDLLCQTHPVVNDRGQIGSQSTHSQVPGFQRAAKTSANSLAHVFGLFALFCFVFSQRFMCCQ